MGKSAAVGGKKSRKARSGKCPYSRGVGDGGGVGTLVADEGEDDPVDVLGVAREAVESLEGVMKKEVFGESKDQVVGGVKDANVVVDLMAGCGEDDEQDREGFNAAWKAMLSIVPAVGEMAGRGDDEMLDWIRDEGEEGRRGGEMDGSNGECGEKRRR